MVEKMSGFAVFVVTSAWAMGMAVACAPGSQVYADIHDGDSKMVTITPSNTLIITPHGNNQTWKVEATLNLTQGCTALIDFNVPNKPNPPPFKLLATFYTAGNNNGSLVETLWGFTNPTSTSPDAPLNEWVSAPQPPKGSSSAWSCPSYGETAMGQLILQDIHDGDQKKITIVGKTLLIQPHNNDQSWKVLAVLDENSCSAVVDFNVAGKPNPPPCKLTMTWWEMSPVSDRHKVRLEFTDPTNACKFGNPGAPLNTWIQLKNTL